TPPPGGGGPGPRRRATSWQGRSEQASAFVLELLFTAGRGPQPFHDEPAELAPRERQVVRDLGRRQTGPRAPLGGGKARRSLRPVEVVALEQREVDRLTGCFTLPAQVLDRERKQLAHPLPAEEVVRVHAGRVPAQFAVGRLEVEREQLNPAAAL